MVDLSSAAILGYLAPVCVAFVFFCSWVYVGARRRRRLRRLRNNDPETAPIGSNRVVISHSDVDQRFPRVKYSDWLEERNRDLQSKGIAGTKVSETTEITTIKDAPSSEDKSTGAPRQCLAHDELGPVAGNVTQSSGIGDGSDGADSSKMCVICMDEFHPLDSVRPLPCGHIFHASCLDPWLTKRHACCPLCKTSYCNPKQGQTGWLRSGSEPAFPQAVVIRTNIIPQY
ncbi:putative RING finger protein [Aspergillus homomorphus CBS 101889]|uniref:RING-type domain-containing protein n=1 Tax=Aspergillus homomorphus (strain CBS 101889) TaxID=1450537 RepID=A0A395I890_ASPHC|nr:hypothetical protein BO97DRAFT_179273 [Aspergillus homomorphus CBS 101889]RAL16019.1 hypothetical protein BO97DRAFT_179273 [Aspergillus homomorphus CBS 101889]